MHQLPRARRVVPSRAAVATVATVAALTAAVLPFTVHADTYPSRPIQLIVPFSAGGDADQSARNLSAAAQGILGQPVVIINKVGAGGQIGSVAAKAAAPDGYTLLLGRVGSQALLPALAPKTTPYRWNDFTFIGLLELNPVVCVVTPDSPYKSLGDLTKALKANPGKLNYSHSGPATVQNLAPQLLFNDLGLKPDAAVNVPYKGGNEVALAVISKEVDFACNNLSSMAGLISGGKLRALVTTTPERLPAMPDVPTAREAGYPRLEAVIGWSALFGPPNMKPEAVQRWAAVLKQISTDQRWITANANYGGVPRVLSPKDTEKFAGDSYAVYSDLVQKAGLEIK